MDIFVGNLSFKTTEEELENQFNVFGEVGSVKIILDRETLKSRGFAFVTMPNQEQATAAIAGLNGKDVNGFALKVNESKPRGATGGPPRPFSGGGGYAGDRPRTSFSSPGGGYNKNRTSPVINQADLDIYDSKNQGRGGGRGKRRGGNDRGSGGRPGGSGSR